MNTLSGKVSISVCVLSFASCTTETIHPEHHHDASTRDSTTEAAPVCSPDVPDACPSPVPSYATEVVPILVAKCNGCHTGGDGPWPLTNHADVLHWRTQVLNELANCTMPPPMDTSRLTARERTMLIDWLVCGAPDN
jgi:hypothetical protein